MLKRIVEIQNVGSFSNFRSGGSIELENFSCIYGPNTYGKTTLTEVLRSLKNNDSSLIQSRKTIPDLAQEQKVILSEKYQNHREREIKFKDGNWISNSIAQNIEVFDAAFIYRNIFTGLEMERKNKENLTQFILGESNVKTAEKIKKLKEQRQKKKRNIELPAYIKNSETQEIEDFLQFSIEELSSEHIEVELIKARKKLRTEKDNLRTPGRILSTEEPSECSVPEIKILEEMENINNNLESCYDDIKDKTIQKVEDHLKLNFRHRDGNEENWIKEGLSYCNNKSCPFCGEPLENAKKLIEVYNSYFAPEYTKFINTITDELRQSQENIENIYISEETLLQRNVKIGRTYQEILDDDEFTAKLNQLDNCIEQLNEADLIISKKDLVGLFRQKIEQKNKKPYKRVEGVDCEQFATKIKKYSYLIEMCMELNNSIRDDIVDFKDQYKDTEAVQSKVDNLEQRVRILEFKKARIEQDEACKKYLRTRQELKSLDTHIEKLEEKLKLEQSQYIEDYFDEINLLFKNFGSRNFTLSARPDKTGHKPVYTINVKFHNKKISNEQLKNVFSDSDRRALALAIFWAKIKLKDDTEKKNQIIILDDPVTSFDDNRVTNTLSAIKQELYHSEQVIVLTHYKNFIKRMCEIVNDNDNVPIKFISIQQNEQTSFLSESSRDDFMKSDYERLFSNIYDFINKKHDDSDYIKPRLRIFLENYYLPTVFAKHIQDKGVNTGSLPEIIDGIFSDESTKRRMHEYRINLNPDSHIRTTNDAEDVRNFAKEMMEYLYALDLKKVTKE